MATKQKISHILVHFQGNRRIVEKHKPKYSRHGKICKVVNKKIKNWQICKIVEFPKINLFPFLECVNVQNAY